MYAVKTKQNCTYRGKEKKRKEKINSIMLESVEGQLQAISSLAFTFCVRAASILAEQIF